MLKTDAKIQKMDAIGSDMQPFRVGVVPIPGFALMSYACTVEPFRAANLLSHSTLYDLAHFSSDGFSNSSGGAAVETGYAIGDTPELDLLLVVAGGDPFAFDDAPTLQWIRDMSVRVPQIGGVSGGSVILARAGVMQGRRMTVHWEHAPELTQEYPDLMVDRRLYVIDRDRITCGGGTAPIDMMHALVSHHHGSVFARLVSDWFLHTDIRAAAAPQRGLPSAQMNAAPQHVVEAVTAMENHVADPLTLSHLALTTGVSARQLNRLFQDTFGQSAMTYYRKLRLDVGRRLVMGSRMRLHEIAEATGFSTAAHFSNQYLQAFNLRPKDDRAGVAG